MPHALLGKRARLEGIVVLWGHSVLNTLDRHSRRHRRRSKHHMHLRRCSSWRARVGRRNGLRDHRVREGSLWRWLTRVGGCSRRLALGIRHRGHLPDRLDGKLGLVRSWGFLWHRRLRLRRPFVRDWHSGRCSALLGRERLWSRHGRALAGLWVLGHRLRGDLSQRCLRRLLLA